MPIEQIGGLVSALRRNLLNPPNGIAEFRERFELMATTLPMIEGVERQDRDFAGISGSVFQPQGADNHRVLLYLHGGGYVIGSVQAYAPLMARLGRASRCRVVGIDYRLAPENPFPAGLEDCIAAYQTLISEGFAPENICVGGDSAGGGMTIALLLRLRDSAIPLPASAFVISPWVDMAATGESMDSKSALDPMIQRVGVQACAHMYLRGSDKNEVLASPIYADLSGLPPLYIQVGTSETLLDDSKRLAERAEACGVECELEIWEDMIHVWHLFAHALDEGKDAIHRLGQFCIRRSF